MQTVMTLKNKLKAGEMIIVISPFLVLAIHALTTHFGFEHLCLWRLLTGHECWGCGMTHAVVEVLKLNFQAAIEYNPFVVIVFPLLLLVWSKYT